jgi:nucleolin
MSNDDAKLFVAGLPESVSEEDVRIIFQSTGGSVLQVSLPRNRETGLPRGIGFVTMGSPDEAEAARSSLDGTFHHGKSILVKPYRKPDAAGGPAGPGGYASGRPSGPPSGSAYGAGSYAPRAAGAPPGRTSAPPPSPDRQVYVGNIPYEATRDEVEALLKDVGGADLQRVHLPTEMDGRIRGYGFVTMSTPEAANAMIDGLREREIRGRKLNVKISQPKSERPVRADSAAPYAGGGGSPYSAPPPPPPANHPPRRSFDDKKRKSGGEDGAGPRKKRGQEERRGGGGGGRVQGWEDDDD